MRRIAFVSVAVVVLAGLVADGTDVVDLKLVASAFAEMRRALEAGCDGVVSSGLEARLLREFIDHRLMVVTPCVSSGTMTSAQSR